jgi:hypothetical protein
MCSGSAPVLADLSKKAAVVAVYHPKPPREVTPGQVREHARRIGMPGALAIDRDWAVLDRWAPPATRSFTSLTFVLDRRGRVRHVHKGGQIEPAEGAELSQQIDALLAEKD